MRTYKVRPFVAVSAGNTRFKTELVVRDPEVYTRDCPKPEKIDNLFESITPQRSATLGLRFVLHKIEYDDDTHRTNYICLDVSVTHLTGGEDARYMVLKNDMPNPNAGSEVVIPFASEARPDIIYP
ncbi:hypothetical protein [Thermoflexibacter ruber]|nr:hypothetical protein [Thermoflexibacter ruber]